MTYRQACYRAWMRVLTERGAQPTHYQAMCFNSAHSARLWYKIRKEAFPWV